MALLSLLRCHVADRSRLRVGKRQVPAAVQGGFATGWGRGRPLYKLGTRALPSTITSRGLP